MSKQPAKPAKQANAKSPEKKKPGKRDSLFSTDKTSLQDDDSQDQPKLTTADIICDPEFEKLVINEEELQQIASRSLEEINKAYAAEHPDNQTDIRVRRPKAWHEIEPPKRYAKLMKPTTPDASLKPVALSEVAGARCDLVGNIVPHSILGDVEEFKKLYLERSSVESRAQFERESREAARRAKRDQAYAGPSEPVEEDPAFRNYKRLLAERDSIQKHLARMVQRAPQELLMNAGDQVRAIEELRYLLDRALPLVGDGKGYRVGSEFWALPEHIGDEIHGLFSTLTQTEKGFPPAFEQIGVPPGARSMDGVGQPDLVQEARYARQWLSSPYLRQRIDQLRKILKQLAPQYPAEPESLIVHGRAVGRAQELTRLRTTLPGTPRTLLIDANDTDLQPSGRDQPGTASPDLLAATGNHVSTIGMQDVRLLFKVVDEASGLLSQSERSTRLLFESAVNEKSRRVLVVENRSPATVVYIEWRQLFPMSTLYQQVPDQLRRETHFYFRSAPVSILPGGSLHLPITFKSSNPGWYRETWQCIVHPRPTVPANGDYPIVQLQGICVDVDRNEPVRRDLERLVLRGEAESISRAILLDLIATMQPPERPSTPVDEYYDEAHRFYEANRLNPDATASGRKQRYFYKHAVMQQLKQLYSDAMQLLILAGSRDAVLQMAAEWDLDLRSLKWLLVQLDESEPKKQTYLEKMNKLLDEMSVAPLKVKTPNISESLVDRNVSSSGDGELTSLRHALCYRALADFVDRFAETAQELRGSMQQNVNAGLLKIGVNPEDLVSAKGLPVGGPTSISLQKQASSKKLQDKLAQSAIRNQKDDLVTVLAGHFRASPAVDRPVATVSSSSIRVAQPSVRLQASGAESSVPPLIKLEPSYDLTVPGFVVSHLDHILQSSQAQSVGLSQTDLVTGLFWQQFREKLTLITRSMLTDTVDRIERAFDNASTV